MKNIINLAWKNIWRNQVRSGVILGAIAIGLLAGTFLLAFINGWIIGTVNSDIKTQYSHVQIHDRDFLANNDINAAFQREAVEAKISGFDFSVQVAYRLSLTGMLASSHNAIGITAKGVVPDEEMQVTDVWQHIADTMGVFLTDDTRNAIIISSKIAEKLKVRLRSRIVFSFQDVHGDMQSISVRVGGIYKTTNTMFDETNVFVRYADILKYTGLPEGTMHEAALLLPNIDAGNEASPQIKETLTDMDVKQWNEINPALSMMLAYTDYMGIIILGIFLFALSFGIINTMLMAVLERTRELGMLGAIGMSKQKIFGMIMLETIFLTLFGGIIGIALGIAFILPAQESGIDLSFFMGDQMEDFGFSSMVYPLFNVEMLIEIVILVVAAAILSAIYPARKALKLNSLEAMRS